MSADGDYARFEDRVNERLAELEATASLTTRMQEAADTILLTANIVRVSYLWGDEPDVDFQKDKALRAWFFGED